MKNILLSFILFSFLGFGFMALAQESDLPESGLTPDSSFYFLKSWRESIQTFFIFGEENKARQFLHLSGVRLAEYQKMIEKGKIEIAQKTLEKYEKQLNHALEKADQAQEKGKDVEKLKETISEKILKHQEVLENVLEKVPEEAKEGIEKAIESSKKGFEKTIEVIPKEKREELERRSEEIQTRLEEKTEKPIMGQEPTEIRYYTCPDGTKVESGKCYAGSGCVMNMSPDLQCPAPTPPVTNGGACETVGKIKYYQCPSTSPVSQVGWCACGPSSGPAKNVWRCGHLPELSCPKPDAIIAEDYISCQKGAAGNYKCSDGAEVRWQCQCLNIVPEATAYYTWKCVLEPTRYCSASNSSAGLAIAKIDIRKYFNNVAIFWETNIPALSYIEYGPAISYGSRAGGLSGAVGSLTEPGTQFVVEGQRLPVHSNTIYHFRIIAEDTNGNKFISQDYTFTTE